MAVATANYPNLDSVAALQKLAADLDDLDQRLSASTSAIHAFDGELQLRFNGTATVQTTGAHTDDHWRQASMGLQVLLASPDDPGRPLTRPDPRLVGMKHSLDAGDEKTARDRFAVIEVAVSSAEWLQISGDEQRRAIMHAANGWAVQPLAP